MRAGGVPGHRIPNGIHSEAALQLTEALRVASPGFAQPRRAIYRRSCSGKRTSASCALLAADCKRAIKDFWRRHTEDIPDQWVAVRGAIGPGAPGLLGLWSVRVPSTQTLLTEAHGVMFAVCDFWRELYFKSPVDVPGFQAVLGRHVPRVSEGAWAELGQYPMHNLRSALDKEDGKATDPDHVEACFIKSLPAPVQWLLVHSYPAILPGVPPPMH